MLAHELLESAQIPDYLKAGCKRPYLTPNHLRAKDGTFETKPYNKIKFPLQGMCHLFEEWPKKRNKISMRQA